MGLGILTFLHAHFPLFLYVGTFLTSAVALFRSAKIGIVYLICILPFTYSMIKAQQYPFGNQLIDILFISIALGSIVQGKKLEGIRNIRPIIALIGITILGLLVGYLAVETPFQTDHWERTQLCKNYLMAPFLYFLVAANIKDQLEIKRLTYLILFAVLVVDWRFWDTFRWVGVGQHFKYSDRIGAFGYLGANHMSAFIVEYTAILVGILLFAKNWKIIAGGLIALLGNIYVLFYSYSRAGYLAMASVFCFSGLFKKKILVASLILLGFGGGIAVSVLPPSVIDRVTMSTTNDGELESSATSRLELWEKAWELFKKNPITGIGYHMIPSYIRVHRLRNLHNYFLQMLVELGIIGFLIFVYIFYRAFRSGWELYKTSTDNFAKGLGVGFCGCVLASAITNLFGDRWSFIQMQGYWWIFWAMVDRSLIIQQTNGGIGVEQSE